MIANFESLLLPILYIAQARVTMSIIPVLGGISIACCIIIVVAMTPRAFAAELFPWHPVLMTVGFLGFMYQGIVKAYRLRSSDGSVRVLGLQTHLRIQLAAALCILLGFIVIYLNKVCVYFFKVGIFCILLYKIFNN